MKCSNCKADSAKRLENRVHSIAVGLRRFEAELPTEVCSVCGDTTVKLDDMGRFEVAVARYLATHGARDGHALRFMRKSLSLRAAELSSLLGIAPETVSRWENHKVSPDPLAVAMLGTMVVEGVEPVRARLEGLLSEASPPTSVRHLAV